ncbi:hypothetical protein CO174_00085 [Candidatus Uhrbacteria bacterium CG_4_9_14_3_um_filter_50_9]|uniref:DUF1294 domain-containing protein n=1 Tax=Candidatus Uhrbacteria bacterium CG_4_9_14_3_um_filter_50_9 TaxID=1975035 RepID=A0A2M7XEV2_9BACT|nr:MAG: hypothetical protein CO174_00085 [Candidatus Uhrbacteria bacterium CG_4_9_14_3_um_filter_50_9]
MLLRPVDKKSLILWIILSLLAVLAAWYLLDAEPIILGLIGVNVGTMIAMLIDKIQASHGARRLSERSLYLMTFLGGSIGMLVSIWLFRHKSRKSSFQFVVGVLVILQLALLLWLFETDVIAVLSL